jgi:hypothetical protein
MKLSGNAFRQILDNPHAEFGTGRKIHRVGQKLATIATEFHGKTARAFTAVKNAIGDNAPDRHFLKKIGEKVDKSFDQAFARSTYELKQKMAELMSKPPKSSGYGIEVRAGWLTSMKSSLTVISGGFAKGQMQGAARLYGGREAEKAKEVLNFLTQADEPFHYFSSRSTAADNMVCFPQTRTSITPQQIEERIFQAVGNTSGAIVIQVEPDSVVAGLPKFSDECLRANLAAARRLNTDAREKICIAQSPSFSLRNVLTCWNDFRI